MTLRAVELLCIPDGETHYLLDLGCGSGLSGEILDEDGHVWVGLDIAPAMLNIAVEKDVEGDLFLQDIGDGLGFRPGTFDGAISISVLQWLCNADKSYHNPWARLQRFFTTLFMCLRRGARAVFQFYPENDAQVEKIMAAATKCGFMGGLVVDYPNSNKAKKCYLCLFAGQAPNGGNQTLPKALGEDGASDNEPSTVAYESSRIQRQQRGSKKGPRKSVKSKDWILHKKDMARKKGDKVPLDSKYTGRKRRPRF
ncbi:18S rRNA (guanine1575-N7)-methyltransferase [Spiromyces aspiralis]|uniref:18S rRNA (Guanine1575-N7)-methyltransferase n=1 Tax=Spiromyces aspiralis TaxID=68401 RepID=A0ACC1HB27_9FUNG|nr:18S rRNA (guanine1575-N7)-methyltransferase [Spiromyces aspiralis]